MRLHDIGSSLSSNDGELGFEVYRRRRHGPHALRRAADPRFLPADNLFSYVEAACASGTAGAAATTSTSRASRSSSTISAPRNSRARSKRNGGDRQTLGIDLPRAEFDRIAAFFAPPPFETGLADDIDRSDPDFAAWVDQNVHAHKQPGYAITTISLKPVGGIPGDATAEQIDLMADLAERYSFDELRVTHSAEHRAAARRQARPLRALAGARRGGAGHGQSRSHQRHHRLPGPRLLQPCQCPLDPCRAEDRAALRRPRAPARSWRTQAQDLGLHQRLRPSPCRPHRHPRRRP